MAQLVSIKGQFRVSVMIEAFVQAIIFIVFPFAMIYAAVSDVFTMTIPNRISIALIAAFLVVAPFIGLTWADLGWHLVAFGAVLAVTFALFAAGVMGGGDAKLLASTALWMGFGPALMNYLLMATVAGGALTLVILILRNSPLAALAGTFRPLHHIVNEKDVPYGIALAFGGLAAFSQSPAMMWALGQ